MLLRYLRNLTRYSEKGFHLVAKMSSSAVESIKEVDIDPEGTFKYILIKIYGDEPNSAKTIVRGYKRCAYHSDIYDQVTAEELIPKNIDSECLGGGRIQHEPDNKKMKVYGYSQGFGKADHSVSVGLLKKTYADYAISWSDEGY